MISRTGNTQKRQVYMVRKWIHGRQGLEGWGWGQGMAIWWEQGFFGGNGNVLILTE